MGKKPQAKSGKHAGSKPSAAASATSDPRFARATYDPRFQRGKKDAMKVQLDERFSHMMTSKEFSGKAKVDQYGRKMQSNAGARELKRYYRIRDEDAEKTEDELAAHAGNGTYDPMRGEGVASSSEDSDMDSSDENATGVEEEDEEEEEEEIPRGDSTRRIGVVNMDWDHIKAVDIFTVLSGFKPDGSTIRSVKIYPSEFGKERLEQEARDGPPRDIFKKSTRDSDASESESEEDVTEDNFLKGDDGEEFDQEALRKYQLDRLRYYFAVVECDTAATAHAIYNLCDGVEVEATSNFFDLRFIPDDMEFDDEPCDVATSQSQAHRKLEFTTQALQHSSVKLTWDEDDPERMKVTRQKFDKNALEDMDFKAYLASSSDESGAEEDVNALRQRYKTLLSNAEAEADEDKAPEGDMEITFTPGLSEAATEMLENRNKEREETLTSEERAERERSRAELELLVMDSKDDRNHFDMKKIIKQEKRKGKKQRYKSKGDVDENEDIQDNFEINVKDPRFAALHDSHHFAIDPTNPRFNKTKAMTKLIEERQRRNYATANARDEATETDASAVCS
ncbi:hypothetical protein THASP1DRAFT_17326 [Thamnocephalis sphaerospora]|uniref:Uncharacterized protein n=1 Tax=Thamnocephalis sphaerospora TaxID=78915 RepID=A0A4V1IWE3_9FUNG|nr:hypothetical protein THASP1DRAFT_17326 [Thamnocephalis sphaerospora]|eukprot:RKP07259.1 hypothetical protein THASP1DRAFT_17326 [Thamnocephalis sphaerospora]